MIFLSVAVVFYKIIWLVHDMNQSDYNKKILKTGNQIKVVTYRKGTNEKKSKPFDHHDVKKDS